MNNMFGVFGYLVFIIIITIISDAIRAKKNIKSKRQLV